MTIIIAEAGVNHNGNMDLAFRLVEAAAQAGADVVKFQTFQAQELATVQADKAAYQKKTTGVTDSQFSMLRKLELTPEQHHQLIAHCQACGIEFLSTAFDLASIDLLASLNLRRWKIPSGEITTLPTFVAWLPQAICDPLHNVANLGISKQQLMYWRKPVPVVIRLRCCIAPRNTQPL